MEFRYVYRRVEDAIGTPLDIEESHHSWLTRQLRYAVRERRDFARNTELTALCLASVGGNSSLDASKIIDKVTEMLDRALEKELPYVERLRKQDAEEEQKKPDYGDVFAQLAKFTEELKASAKDGKDANGKGDVT